jgi:hypothetical protein
MSDIRHPPPNAESSIAVTVHIPRELVTVVAAPPEWVTQRNVEAVAGMTRGVFLDLIRRPDAPPVTRLGKLRMVERVVFCEWLRALATAPQRNDEATDVDAVLAELGLERTDP